MTTIRAWGIGCVLFALLITATVGYAAAAEDSVLGVWVTEGGKSRVELFKDEKGRVNGKIIWLKEPCYREDEEDTGQPRRDKNNPEPKLQSRPIMQLQVLSAFSCDEGYCKKGRIYDPENGKTYKCKMSLEKAGKELHVRGYIGISVLGRTTVWTRYAPAEKESK